MNQDESSAEHEAGHSFPASTTKPCWQLQERGFSDSKKEVCNKKKDGLRHGDQYDDVLGVILLREFKNSWSQKRQMNSDAVLQVLPLSRGSSAGRTTRGSKDI